MTSSSSSRSDWLVFFALGLIWGSSYLFIKIAVNDFGTFTLVAVRLGIGKRSHGGDASTVTSSSWA